MPTYDYECTKCGHTFEAFQHMTDKPLSRCPVCKGAVRRLIGSGMGIIFKGSGFYSTDNKKSSTLMGGNGSSRDSKDKDRPAEKTAEKTAEKPKETSGASTTGTTEKKAAS